jgi:peptidoglycan/LPS O-acetylase OafA/YrhL
MSSFSTYLIGFLILVIGLALAAHLLGAPTTWIVVGVIVAVGVGIISATTRTRTRDPHGPQGPYGGGPRTY